MLGFLVTFAEKMDSAGLLPELDPGVSEGSEVAAVPKVAGGPKVAQGFTAPADGKQPAVPGAHAKAGPPLPPEALHRDADPGAPSSSSSGSTARPSSLISPSSKCAPGIPSAPPTCEGTTHTRGRLVCTPNQMKQFLYGNAPRPKSSTGQSSDALMMNEYVLIL